MGLSFAGIASIRYITVSRHVLKNTYKYYVLEQSNKYALDSKKTTSTPEKQKIRDALKLQLTFNTHFRIIVTK